MKPLKRSAALAWIIALSLTGSFVTFYMTNLVLSDVSNMFYGVHDVNFIASLPGFLLVPDYILATLYVLRAYYKPHYQKGMALRCLRRLAVCSALGVLCAALTGALIYGSFTAPYPFAGYTIGLLLFHGGALAFSLWGRRRVRRAWPEGVTKPRPARYRIYTTVLCLLVFLAYDRFGALLWAVTYAQKSTLGITWMFYASLAVPMGMLAHAAFEFFGVFARRRARAVINAGVLLGLNAVFCVAVLAVGMRNTQFVAAISPALAIERLATWPIDTVVIFTLNFLLGGYLLGRALRKLRRDGD